MQPPAISSYGRVAPDGTRRRDAPVSEIAKVIGADPAMSSRLLRTVNSSFYRRSHTVSTVSHAITVLGVVSVKTIVLGFSLVQNLRTQQTKGFDHLKYWRHSIYSATAAANPGGETEAAAKG